MVTGTLAVDGCAVTFGKVRRGLSLLLAVPNVTAHGPPLNGQCTKFILFDVAL